MGDYDKTLGLMLLGAFLNTFLLGLVCYQFGVYFSHKFRDPWLIQVMVITLLLTDLFHSGSLIYLCWFYVVQNYANPASLAFAEWPLPWTGVLTSIAAVITHLFLSWRYYSLTKNLWVYLVLVAIAFTSMGLGCAVGIKCWILGEFIRFGEALDIITAWLVCQAGLDIVIAGLLCHVFYNSRTGFHRTDRVLRRLIKGSVQTGLFAAIWSIGDLTGFLVSPDSWIYFFFAACIGRMYTNTLMDTLNSRKSLKIAMTGTRDLETNDAYQLHGTRQGSQTGPIRIKTVTETVIDSNAMDKKHSERSSPTDQDDSKFHGLAS